MTSHPMVEQVDRLIGNVLAGGGELFLPGVGSLYTVRQGAKRLSRRSVLPPYRTVTFSSQQRGASLVDEIARALAQAASAQDSDCPCTPAENVAIEPFGAQAQDIYDRWLGRTLADGVLTVSGVGVLKFKNFTTEEVFDRRLNPHGHEPVRIKSGHRFDWAIFVGGIALIVAAVIGGYEFLMLYNDDIPGRTAVMELSDAGQPVEDDGAWIDRAIAGRPAEGSDAVAAEVSGDSSDGISAGTAGQRRGDETQEETERRADNSGTQPGVSASAGEDTPSGALRTGTAGTAEAPARLVSGHSYVVLGVFSTAVNASRAVQSAASKDSSFAYGVYRFGEKFMVSAFEAEDADACRQFIREHSGLFPGMWTYTAR